MADRATAGLGEQPAPRRSRGVAAGPRGGARDRGRRIRRGMARVPAWREGAARRRGTPEGAHHHRINGIGEGHHGRMRRGRERRHLLPVLEIHGGEGPLLAEGEEPPGWGAAAVGGG